MERNRLKHTTESLTKCLRSNEIVARTSTSCKSVVSTNSDVRSMTTDEDDDDNSAHTILKSRKKVGVTADDKKRIKNQKQKQQILPAYVYKTNSNSIGNNDDHEDCTCDGLSALHILFGGGRTPLKPADTANNNKMITELLINPVNNSV